MADDEDRTEAATARRLERARAAGQAPLSREVGALAVLIAGVAVLGMVTPKVMPLMMADLSAMVAGTDRLSPGQAIALGLHALLWGAGPVVLATLFAGSAAVFVQTGFLIHLEALMPDLARLDPRRGLRRIAGPAALLEAGKAVLKLAIVGFAGWHVVGAMAPTLSAAMLWTPEHLARGLAHEVGALLLAMLGAQSVLAAFDVIRARIQHARSLRMSRHEIRE
jgi:flagellar biosynthetic protein FlhB